MWYKDELQKLKDKLTTMDKLKDSIEIVEKGPPQKRLFVANVSDTCSSDSVAEEFDYITPDHPNNKIVSIKHFTARYHTNADTVKAHHLLR